MNRSTSIRTGSASPVRTVGAGSLLRGSLRRATRLAAALLVLVAAMTHQSAALAAQAGSPTGGAMATREDSWVAQRRQMVETQIRKREIRQPQVLSALETVPRHLFVPEGQRADAYADHPLAIGWGQTISQPYIVALMTELLELRPTDRVLEIGTGSGYHAAVLSRVAGKVYTIEIIEALADEARRTLASLGYDNVEVRAGDGYQGWPQAAPFDAVILTAAPPRLPQPLIDQLKVGGRLVVPLGAYLQDLTLYVKTADGLEKRTVTPVRFVPMTGEIQRDQR